MTNRTDSDTIDQSFLPRYAALAARARPGFPSRAMAEPCRFKQASAGDKASKDYYRLCHLGWQRWLENVEAGRARNLRLVGFLV